MNIVELISLFREEADDEVEPYLWSNTQVVGFYNDAEKEACKRRDLIFDNTTTAICEIDIDDTTATYDIHGSITKITAGYLEDAAGDKTYLRIVDRDEMDRLEPLWRDAEGDPEWMIVDELSVQIVPPPIVDYTLHLEVYRTPLTAMFYPVSPVPTPAPDPLIVSPEIAVAHHEKLLHWALHRAYSRRDVTKSDPGEADKHEKRFGRYFGFRSTADRGRSGRANRPHKNKVW